MRRAAVVAAASAVLAPGAAYATWARTTSAASLTASTVSVGTVTSLAAAASCGPVLSLKAKVVLSFGATTTARATGLQVLRATGGGAFSAVGTAAATATSYTDSGLNVNTTYRYIVRTLVGSWYRDTALVSTTTPLVCA